jgi:hypothetical protein
MPQVICIALTPNDGSELRAEVEGKVEVFVDLTADLARGLPVAAQTVNRCVRMTVAHSGDV